jgi:hypothetical protein
VNADSAKNFTGIVFYYPSTALNVLDAPEQTFLCVMVLGTQFAHAVLVGEVTSNDQKNPVNVSFVDF